MTPALKISEKIISRLSNGENTVQTGKLYGILTKNTLTILGIQLETDDGIGSNLINSFPAEIYACGVINILNDSFDEQTIKSRLSEVYVTDNPVFINYSNSNELNAFYFVNGQLEKTTHAIIDEQDVLSQFLHVRLQADVPLSCELSHESLKDAFFNLRKSVASGIMSFGIAKNQIYLVGNDNENGIVGVSGNPGIGEIWDEGNVQSEGNARKKKQQTYDVDVINVDMLKKFTIENNGNVLGSKEHAPLCVLDKKQCKTVSFNVKIDTLSMVHRQTKLASLYEILVESSIRFLRLLETTFLANLDKLSKPQTFHFYPSNCAHFITRIYLSGDSDADLQSERSKLHSELALDLLHPYFRRSNNYAFKTNQKLDNIPLTNPHESLKPTDNCGRVSLVKGKYTYYHYCQDKMDDNGWGCAYRSLQTLASWFKLQGYTEKEVPTFKDIQKCLVDIGDKQSNFVGSKQWIGSTEVNFVLNALLGVTSKILYVSSGEEMAGKGPELASHFETHGTPVMIGGGVLAHTILGVDYNSNSGGLRFLILDPHYTGSEDLHTIQSKGWCGWKGVDFWDKASYYNMCLPLVPIMV